MSQFLKSELFLRAVPARLHLSVPLSEQLPDGLGPLVDVREHAALPNDRVQVLHRRCPAS